MKLWLTKLSVVLITFMTLGMFIPPTYLDEAKAQDEEVLVAISDSKGFDDSPKEDFCDNEEDIDIHTQFVSYVSLQAKQQSFQKFGPKIASKVGDEFVQVILPKIEQVILEIASQTPEEDLVAYEITESPSSGYSEKIFHIYNQQSGKDVARFHVRRVNSPKEGHLFNFHYHLNEDKFEHHYQLGNIVWDKNTPPKWMS